MGNGDLIKWTCHDMSIFSMEFTVDLDDLTIFNIFEASKSAAYHSSICGHSAMKMMIIHGTQPQVFCQLTCRRSLTMSLGCFDGPNGGSGDSAADDSHCGMINVVDHCKATIWEGLDHLFFDKIGDV